MASLTDAEIDAALERGQEAQAHEPRAQAVRYDRERGGMIVDLTNGCSFVFPPRLAQGLEQASDDELGNVVILGSGIGLHWDGLDVDLSVPGLLAGLFGTKAYMARRSGEAASLPKLFHSPGSAAKAGRPRKAGAT
jgi:hypothetical protein